jgi:hypothetical protein
MSMHLNLKDFRHEAYRERARTARRAAVMLMPLACLVLGTAVWKDPDLQPRVQQGIETLHPIAVAHLAELSSALPAVFRRAGGESFADVDPSLIGRDDGQQSDLQR